MPLKQNWTDRDTVTATFLNQLAGAVNSAVTSLAGKYTKPSGGIPASDLAGNVLTQPVADGRYASLPANTGTVGQVLTKTAGGSQWATPSSGGASLMDDGTGLYTISGSGLTDDGTGLYTIGV